MKLYRILIILTVLTSSSLALADDRLNLKIIPIKSMNYQNNDLVVSYELPCGTDVSGLIVIPKGAREVDLGILGVARRFFCTGMSKSVSQRVTFLDPTKISKINYIPADIDRIKDRLIIAPIRDIRVLPTGYANQYVIQSVLDSNCRDHLGFIIQNDPSSYMLMFGSLDIANMRKNSQGKCQKSGQTVKLIDFLRLGATKKLKTSELTLKPQEAEKMYHVKINQIKKGSVRKTTNGGIKVSYVRQCNEAPIGIVMETMKNSDVGLGVVVAHFFNKQCVAGERKAYLESISSNSLKIPANKKISLLANSRGFAKYVVKTPNAFSAAKKNNQIGLKVTYFNGCSSPKGIVHAVSNDSGFRADSSSSAVGILEQVSTSSGRCVRAVKQKNMFVPYFAKDKKGNIAPLRLRGSLYF